MNKIWFTADLHFGHKNVIKYCNRPFSSVDEMNKTLIDNWNKVVKPEDTVYILGDLAMGVRHVKECVPLLNGRKVLIIGNHDYMHPACRGKTAEKQIHWKKIYKDAGINYSCGDYIGYIISINNNDYVFNLSHMPYKDLNQPNLNQRYEAYTFHDKSDFPLLHGHIHNVAGLSYSKAGNLQLNVGVDAPNLPWSGQYRPISESEIIDLILSDDSKINIKELNDDRHVVSRAKILIGDNADVE